MTPRLVTGLWLLALLSIPLGATADISPNQEDGPASYKLKGGGGLELRVPADPAHPWNTVKHDDVLLVLERPPVPEKGLPFGLLLVAVEQGPDTTTGIDWDRVKDNIISAAKNSGSDLKLNLGGSWQVGKNLTEQGVQAQKLVGSMTANEREVDVSMVAMVAPGRLVTISELGPTGGGASVYEKVARSVRMAASR